MFVLLCELPPVLQKLVMAVVESDWSLQTLQRDRVADISATYAETPGERESSCYQTFQVLSFYFSDSITRLSHTVVPKVPYEFSVNKKIGRSQV